jgi:hypothetical protein
MKSSSSSSPTGAGGFAEFLRSIGAGWISVADRPKTHGWKIACNVQSKWTGILNYDGFFKTIFGSICENHITHYIDIDIPELPSPPSETFNQNDKA